MTVSAHIVAAALRERLPGLPTKKLHKLLYYCQGHHAAMFGTDLEHLTRAETPWQYANAARLPGESARVELEWIRDYFATTGAADGDEDEPLVDSAEIRAILKGADARRGADPRPDDPEAMYARVRAMGEDLKRSA